MGDKRRFRQWTAFLWLASASSLSAQVTRLESAVTVVGGGNEVSHSPTLSDDGRFLSFASVASNLVVGDTNALLDVFVFDRASGSTARVSVASGGTQANALSYEPAIAGSGGRFIAFTSRASNLVVGDTNAAEDVFVHDQLTTSTTRVSVATDGTQGNGYCKRPAISDDGRYVAFFCTSNNLVANDTNGALDVFVHDRTAGTTTRVSVATNGSQANGNGFVPSISGDGRFVAFMSDATNLVSGDTNAQDDIFVRDTLLGTTARVSVGNGGAQGNGGSSFPSISDSGRVVAFKSAATNLVAGDTNGQYEIFVRDTLAGTLSRVAVATGGTQGNDWSDGASVSGDGRFVAFFSIASNLVVGDTNGLMDAFVHDRTASTTIRVSADAAQTQGDGQSNFASISGDARYVAFSSDASNWTLASGINGPFGDVFTSRRVDLTTTSISSALPDPSLVGAPVTVNVNVVGDVSAPLDGQVVVTASGGESCTDMSPSAGGGNTAFFSCELTFASAGNRTLVAEYSASGRHDRSMSAPDAHTVEPLPSLTISDVSTLEGTGGSTNFVFTITRSHNLNSVSVNASTANGGAVAGTDYTAVSNQVASFAPGGPLAANVTVAVNADAVLEPNEQFELNLTSAVGSTISDGQGIGTIINDDTASISIANSTANEGNSGASQMGFTATLVGAVQGGFAVPVSSLNATATAGSDYTAIAVGSTFTFTGTNGETRTVFVAITGDTVLEPDELFSVQLGAPSNADVTVSAATGTGTITNDDTASVAIGNVTVTEGNSGTTNAVLTATLTSAVQGGFTVPVSSANGTATAGSDYTEIAAGTTLTFTGTAGETRTVSIAVAGDTVLESGETFVVLLGAPSNAGVTVSTGTGTATITNDDAASLTIGNASVVEGNLGTTNASLTVALVGDVQGSFTVPVSIANGTAAAGSDFTPLAPGTVVSFAGSSGETVSVVVVVNGDTVVESNETYTVNLGTPSNAAVSLSDGSGAGTINNDDAAIVMINNVTDAEGNAGASTLLFTATLSGIVQDSFTVPYQTADNTAQAGSDYTAASGNLTFTGTNGQTRAVAIAVTGDTTPELEETFHVDLLAPSLAGVAANPARGTGTIVNDDLFADISVSNGNGGATLLPGQITTYTVVVTNTSAVVDVPAVQITQTLPAALLGASWTCSSAGGAHCPASGTGVVATTLGLPRGTSVTYLVSATVDGSSVVPSIAATVSANVVAPYQDLNLANNSVTDLDVLLENFLFANGFE